MKENHDVIALETKAIKPKPVKKKNPHAGHRERMKNRYINGGLDNFDYHEILEMLLFYSVPRKDTNEIAHMLLEEYGSFVNLLEADPVELANNPLISKNTAVLLTMIIPIVKKYQISKWNKSMPLDRSSTAVEYIRPLFLDVKKECAYVICLDNQLRLIHAVKISEGDLHETPIYPRTIIETAIKFKAKHVIIAHNHLGGVSYRSEADDIATSKIYDALRKVDIVLRDHIIIAWGDYYSYLGNKRPPVYNERNKERQK